MSVLRQIGAVTSIALASIFSRLGTSLIVVIGTATTVAVLVSALAVATGFTRAAAKSGSPDRAIVLSGLNEGSSGISRANVATIIDAPGVAHTATGAPIASAETVISVAITDSNTGRDAYVPVRGVGPQPLALRPEIKLLAGRLFDPGRREVIVGQGLAERIGGLSIDSTIPFPDGNWKVVGVFAAGGGSHESELLTATTSLMSAFGQSTFNSVTVRIVAPRDYTRFNAALTSSPTASVKAQREDEYYVGVSRPISRVLGITAYALGLIMAFGAVFGALNTMFSAVRARRTEIATLRAIGFGASSVIASVVIEALVLCLVGALFGELAARVLLEGARISTMVAAGTPMHIRFGLDIDRRTALVGAVFACGIALAAAVFAARQASRISIAAGIQRS